MAGIRALIECTNSSSPWFICPDGKVIEPIDILQLLFPNEGCEQIGENVCFVPRHFQFQALLNLLPAPSLNFLPDDLVDATISLFLLCFLTTVGMIVAKTVWNTLDSRFSTITPPHKQWYVVANISKAFFLAVMAFSSRYWIGSYKGFYLDEFQAIELKRVGVMYVTTDLVALYMVPKLLRSTVGHHVTTITLCMVIAAMNLSIKGWDGLLGVGKMSLLYGACSSIAFPVNAYLGLRVVYPKAKWLPALVKISLWTYIGCCAGNWSIHALWLLRVILSLEFSIFTLLYMVAIAFMMNDDIVLIKWLLGKKAEGSKMADKSC